MTPATVDLCAAILTIGYGEPPGMFYSEIASLIELGMVKAIRGGQFRLTDRGMKLFARIEAGNEIDDEVFSTCPPWAICLRPHSLA